MKAQINVQAENKFSCRLCPKSFSGENFLVKHLNLKHADAPEADRKKVKNYAL